MVAGGRAAGKPARLVVYDFVGDVYYAVYTIGLQPVVKPVDKRV